MQPQFDVTEYNFVNVPKRTGLFMCVKEVIPLLTKLASCLLLSSTIFEFSIIVGKGVEERISTGLSNQGCAHRWSIYVHKWCHLISEFSSFNGVIEQLYNANLTLTVYIVCCLTFEMIIEMLNKKFYGSEVKRT